MQEGGGRGYPPPLLRDQPPVRWGEYVVRRLGPLRRSTKKAALNPKGEEVPVRSGKGFFTARPDVSLLRKGIYQ